MRMARISRCELVRKGEIKHIPKDSQDKGLPNCVGYVDSMTDEALDECRSCGLFWMNDKVVIIDESHG